MRKTPEQVRREFLLEAYTRAGEDFLAEKLARMLSPINSEKDRILHNDIMTDIGTMLGTRKNALEFMRELSRSILNRTIKTKKAFASRVAGLVLRYGNRKE